MIKNSLKLIAIIFIIALTSCERDDICTEAITPHLVVRFYDSANPTQTKNVSNLSIFVDSLGTDVLIGSVISSTDSIAIPLRIDEDLSKIKLSKNISGTDLADDFKLNYSRSAVFVSRSCGFKTIYENLTVSDLTTNWIQNISVNKSIIDNETEAHISIFH
jgi:hypothetical protein